ncbi:MAG: hypothetical protein WCO56_04520 [Verrucomicrobiota bacterium]
MWPPKFICRIIRPKRIKPVIIRAIRHVVPKRITSPPKPLLVVQYFRALTRFINLDRQLFSHKFAFGPNLLGALVDPFPMQNYTTPLPATPAVNLQSPIQLPNLQELITKLANQTTP